MIDEVLENKSVPLALLFPHERNYRAHPDLQIKQIAASLARFGQVRSIVAQACENGSYTIVAGHGVVLAAERLGYRELRADILPSSWSPEQITGYLVADNHLSQEATDDEALLTTLLQEQYDAGYDLASMGSDEETLRQMLSNLGNDYLGDGEGSEDNAADEQEVKRASLAERFIIPPFSVLDARQGYWQERKRAWLALGIQSEIGRGEELLLAAEEVTTESLHFYRRQNKAAQNGLLGEAEQARSHYSMGGTPAPVGRGGLSDQLANRTKNGKSPARCFGQDLMRGEHQVGKAQEGETAQDLTLLRNTSRQDAGERAASFKDQGRQTALQKTGDSHRKATSVKGLLGGSLETIHGYDTGPAGGTVSQSGTSIFDPVLCELAYSWFCPPHGTVLDPFAGGSVRGIVAAALGRQYVGIDLRAEQIAANEAQAATILRSHPPRMLDPADASFDYTPDYTPVEEHGGYLVKRDDLFQIAGVRGGKVRTVWALAQDAKGLVSSGSRHSPHVHRVAAIAQRLGIPCRVHIATGENTPDVQGAEDAGAEIIRHKAGYLNVLNARAREDAEQSGYTLIPFGVVCPEAVKQLSGQVDTLPQEMKRLVVPVGSGISLSGILQGLQRIGRTVPVLGVCVGKDALEVLDHYAPKNWRSTVELVKSPYKFEEHPKETHLGTLPLDPTYEAKCLPFLQPGDCLWSIGLRASAVEEESLPVAAPLPRWVVGDSRNLPDLCPDVEADLLFTCPPYYDLEVYSDDPQDLSTVGTYEEFVHSYRLILKHAIAQLKDNRFVCVVVGDIRDKKGFYRNFVGDTISACQDAGAKLYNEAILVTSVGSLPIRVGKQFSSGRKLGKTHQNCLVFCKGDPHQAVQDCGPVVVHLPDEQEATHD